MRLTRLSIAALGLALSAATLTSAGAHSLKELEGKLGDRERYFQSLNKETPGFELVDADGRAVELADFQSKVVVLHFVYTNCPDICPLHAERIAEIQELVNQTPMRDQVRFVSVTTDPVSDTPDVMRGYGPDHGLDPVNWVFLTVKPGTPEDTTRTLAERFGHKFTKLDESYQKHSIVTHVIDRKGRWRANFYGLKFEPTNLVQLINALVNGEHQTRRHGDRKFWQRLWELF